MSIFLAGFLSVLFGIIFLFVLYVIVRYVPIIERDAFDVPRHRVPQQFRIPPHVCTKEIRISLKETEQITLRYIAAREPSRRLVVFCHETGADWRSWYKHGYFLPENGFDVLTFSYNENQRSFQWPSARELSVIQGVLEWVRRERPGYQVSLFGVSKGSSLAAAASGHPIVKSVVLDGVFSTHRTLKSLMKKWVHIYVTHKGYADILPNWLFSGLCRMTLWYAGIKQRTRFFSVERFMSILRVPVLLIHAERDAFVQLCDVERIRGLVRARSDLWIVRGASHSESVTQRPADYRSAVMRFFNRNLNQGDNV